MGLGLGLGWGLGLGLVTRTARRSLPLRSGRAPPCAATLNGARAERAAARGGSRQSQTRSRPRWAWLGLGRWLGLGLGRWLGFGFGRWLGLGFGRWLGLGLGR